MKVDFSRSKAIIPRMAPLVLGSSRDPVEDPPVTAPTRSQDNRKLGSYIDKTPERQQNAQDQFHWRQSDPFNQAPTRMTNTGEYRAAAH